MAALPRKDMALRIAFFHKQLSMRATKRLGDFEVTYLYDKKALEAATE
jgi:hypothetical protein